METRHGILTKFDPLSVWLVTDGDTKEGKDVTFFGKKILGVVAWISLVSAALASFLTLVAMALIKHM